MTSEILGYPMIMRKPLCLPAAAVDGRWNGLEKRRDA